MSYEDQTKTCKVCGKSFVFTAGEQEFYAQKGFVHDPLRCPECRHARRQERMNPSSGSNKPRSGKGQPIHKPRIQQEATCALCGATTTVPFVPRGDKPIYCFDCLQKKREHVHQEIEKTR